MHLTKDAQKIYEQIPDIKIIYYLLTGLSYSEIGSKFYSYDTNKFIYQVRKLMKQFNVANRRHLAYFAVENKIVDFEKLKIYKNA